MTSRSAASDILSTQLLGEVLAEVLAGLTQGAHQPLRVLDLGPACAATVAFFSQYRCTLRFADLDPIQLREPAPSDGEQDRDQSWIEHLCPQLDLPVDSRFDLCLFWDLLHHLDESGVRALGALLGPHLHSASRGHGFAVHNRGAVLHHRGYGILDASRLVVIEEDASQRLPHPHPQSALNSLLGCLATRRSVLRSDGRLEMLLAAT